MSVVADSTLIFRRMVAPERGTLTPELARYVLDLDFPAEDRDQFVQLSAKAKLGKLTSSDADMLDGYLHVDSVLAILRLTAQRSLN